MVEQSLAGVDFKQLTSGRKYHPSPLAWEDQNLYFLLLDRFSDGREDGFSDIDGNPVQGTTPVFRVGDVGNAPRQQWWDSRTHWLGGTLKGVESKIGYLKRLGVTAVWISPVFKQVAWADSYHGYGIQNFLDIDPHFGTREDLKRFVEKAHEAGIYVILDIILNHTGDVFDYNADRYWTVRDGHSFMEPRWDGQTYAVKNWRDDKGNSQPPFGTLTSAGAANLWPHGAVWPSELQNMQTFRRKGEIRGWDYDPEFLEGDFFGLKDLYLGEGPVDTFQPSPALSALAAIYKFWIAYADVDGYRIDTVKHIELGASRFFVSAIHEFSQSIGKENFYLIGEITGGRNRAFRTLEETGINAALGIDDVPQKLEGMIRGTDEPNDYFKLFRNSVLVNKDSHVWFNNKIVTMFNDHDMVGRRKARLASYFGTRDEAERAIVTAVALNSTTMGIPCLYYGTEQCFNGADNDSDAALRETMFGGAYGSWQTKDRHFFDESSWTYRKIAEILALRRQYIALRRGRQYLRPISGDGKSFGLPTRIGSGPILSVIAWSRIFADQEMIVAVNTDVNQRQSAWVTVEQSLHAEGDQLNCIYHNEEGMVQPVRVEALNGRSIYISLPPAGLALFI